IPHAQPGRSRAGIGRSLAHGRLFSGRNRRPAGMCAPLGFPQVAVDSHDLGEGAGLVSDLSRVKGERTLILERRINTICDQFETAWRTNPPVQLDAFLEGWHGPERTALLRELVPLDVDYRRSRGMSYALHDYLVRFPDLDSGWLTSAMTLADAG